MTKRLTGATGGSGAHRSGPLRADPYGVWSGATPRIAAPGELLQAVPYLLGFHPTESLVLVGLRDGVLVVTARLDLSDTGATTDADPDTGTGPGKGPLPGTLASMCDGGATEVIAAIYSDDDVKSELPWTQLAKRLARLADTLPCRLHDVLLVIGERWWSLACGSAQCCPSSGRAMPVAPSAFTTRATVEGIMPLPDRTALAAVLDPLPDAPRQVLSPLLARAENDAVAAALSAGSARHERAVKRALFAAARASAQARWQPPDDAEVARFAAALTRTALRDAVWLAIDARRLDGRPLWRELARRVPSPYDAAPLFLYGWSSWRAGDGALAGIAADRAIASDPGYSAADLLLAALSHGVDPRRFPRLSSSA